MGNADGFQWPSGKGQISIRFPRPILTIAIETLELWISSNVVIGVSDVAQKEEP
jgi:hypothetical protein